MNDSNMVDVASFGYSNRITRFLSVGGNINFGSTERNSKEFTTFGIGCLVKPAINRNSYYQIGLSKLNLFINPILYNEYAVLYPKELIGFLKGVNPGVINAVNGRKIRINNAPKRPNITPILISLFSIEISYHTVKLYIKKYSILINHSNIYLSNKILKKLTKSHDIKISLSS